MKFNLTEVENKIGYHFKDAEILKVAFSHASFTNEKRGEKNNERIEFLGDSVLGFVVADFLFQNTTQDEGDMTAIKQSIVSCKPLVNACNDLKIYENLLVGDKVSVTDKLKENLMESVIGAIYLDGGIEEARSFIYKNLILPNVERKEIFIDYKSKINELSSKKRFSVSYELVEKIGTDNNPTHTVSIVINGKVLATATANGKRQNAEQLVAKIALEKIK